MNSVFSGGISLFVIAKFKWFCSEKLNCRIGNGWRLLYNSTCLLRRNIVRKKNGLASVLSHLCSASLLCVTQITNIKLLKESGSLSIYHMHIFVP